MESATCEIAFRTPDMDEKFAGYDVRLVRSLLRLRRDCHLGVRAQLQSFLDREQIQPSPFQ